MKTKNTITLIIILFAIMPKSQAQLGIGTQTPSLSAQLDVSSTSKGFLPPRLTSTQRDAISNPAIGLVLYNSTLDQLQYYKRGAETLDANSTAANQTSPAPTGAYQSFTAVASGKLSSVEINLRNPASDNSSTAIVKIYSGAGINGTLLATSDPITPSAGYNWNKFNFSGSNLATITASAVYTLFVTPIGSTSNYTWISQTGYDAYSGGQWGWPESGFFPTSDMPFKTYIVSPTWTSLL